MNPERHQQIRNLFEAVVERPAATRAAFLAEACAGDIDLRAEIESLLAHQELLGSFLEKPPIRGRDHQPIHGFARRPDPLDWPVSPGAENRRRRHG